MTFGLKSPKRKITNHQLFINDTKIDRVLSYKYLGITLDDNLDFNIHIENCLKLVSYKAYLLGKVRKYINVHTAVTIYKSMILPIFEYDDILYEGSNLKRTNDLQTAQNRILRICNNTDRYISTQYLHDVSKTNLLKDRRILHLNLFMFKQKGNVHIVNTRDVRTRAHDAPLFNTVKFNNEKYKKNIYCKGALSWNSLTVAERNQEDYTIFKSQQKQKLKLLLNDPPINV